MTRVCHPVIEFQINDCTPFSVCILVCIRCLFRPPTVRNEGGDSDKDLNKIEIDGDAVTERIVLRLILCLLDDSLGVEESESTENSKTTIHDDVVKQRRTWEKERTDGSSEN